MKILMHILLCAVFSYGYEVVNGTAAVLEVDASTQKLLKESGPLPLLAHPKDPNKRIAFVAVPYRQSEDIDLVRIVNEKKELVRLHVRQGDYKKETLSVDPAHVSPPKEALPRIQAEREEAMALYGTFTPTRYWNAPFEFPMQSVITSDFGNARVFNDTLKSYHSGTDFRAAVGTPIVATNEGVVVLAKERYYAGGSVILDHGEGVYSVYYHLSSLPHPVGARVKKGEVVGLSGASGRVTGPHLHFGFMVQGVPIDPLDFIAKVNALFE